MGNGIEMNQFGDNERIDVATRFRDLLGRPNGRLL